MIKLKLGNEFTIHTKINKKQVDHVYIYYGSVKKKGPFSVGDQHRVQLRRVVEHGSGTLIGGTRSLEICSTRWLNGHGLEV